MTTSNSTDFTVTRDEIVTEALELVGVFDSSRGLYAADLTSCSRTLNMLIKAWQVKGLFLWTFREATLFPSLDTQAYLLGPTGAHCTETYAETTLAANAAQGATTVTLTSTAGIVAVDHIGIVLDDGSLFWTTVGNPATTTIVDGLTSAAAAGNKVYAYTSKIDRPLDILSVRRRTSANTDTPIERKSLDEYYELPSKFSSGAIVQVAYDPQLNNGVLYTWPQADSVRDKILFRAKFPIQDFDGDTDNPHFPVEWFFPLSIALAYHIAPKFRISLGDRQDLKLRMDEAIDALNDFEETSVTLAPRSR